MLWPSDYRAMRAILPLLVVPLLLALAGLQLGELGQHSSRLRLPGHLRRPVQQQAGLQSQGQPDVPLRVQPDLVAAGRTRVHLLAPSGPRYGPDLTASMSLLDAIRRDQAELEALRHDLHAHPELGLEERRTAEIVARKLESWGIEVHRGVGRTGVVGVLRARVRQSRRSGCGPTWTRCRCRR